MDTGEECDDGNTLDGDGCSALCRRESLYPGFIQVVNGRIFYRDAPWVIVGAAFLPQGATTQEALESGFNMTINGSLGLRMVWVPHGASVGDFMAPYLDDPGVLGWVGPDEPLWNGISVNVLQTEFVDPVRALDPWGRPILINHAPRGSSGEPDNFDLLLPYLALSDIASMDIYPIPEGNGHSILQEHPGLSAVGAHTKLLIDLAAQSGGHNAVVMILQGAGMGRIPSERWEMPEIWQEDADVLFDHVRFAQAGDFDGDGVAELAIGYVDGTGDGHIAVYDFQNNPFGGRLFEVQYPGQPSLAHTWRVTAGDYNNDGKDDLVLVLDVSDEAQELWLVPATDNGFDAPQLLYTRPKPDIVWDVARHWVSGDFDGDGCDDLLFSYDYPDPNRQVWFMVPSGCTGFSNLGQLGTRAWFLGSKSELDLSRLRAGALFKPQNGSLPTLFLAGVAADGKLEILRMTARVDGLNAPETMLHDGVGTLDPGQLVHMAAHTFRGRSDPQLITTFADSGSMRFLAMDASSSIVSESQLDQWLHTPGSTAAPGMVSGGCTGDFDGDGLPDIVLPVSGNGNRLRLMAAFSTGRFFGARDPLPQELRFMAMDAFARGAQGVVFWGQEFVDAAHPAWARLKSASAELGRLRPYLEGENTYISSHDAFAERWVQTPSGVLLLVAHESRQPGAQFVSAYNPGAPLGTRVSRWNQNAFTPDDALDPALPFSDPTPFGAYEARAYLFTP